MEETNKKERGRYLPLIAVTVSAVLLISALIYCIAALDGRAKRAEERSARIAAEAVYEVDEGLFALSNEFDKLLAAGHFSPYARHAYERVGIIASTTETSVSYLPLPYEITIKLSSFLNRAAEVARLAPQARGLSVYELSLLSREFAVAFHSYATTRDCSRLYGVHTVEEPRLFDEIEMKEQNAPRCFKGLERLAEVSEDEAARVLENSFGAENVEVIGFTEEPDAYVFSLNVSGADGMASVSLDGGVILSYNVQAEVTEVLTKSSAIDTAKAYVEKLGYTSMEAVWYSFADGFNYVSLAPVDDGIKYYTDLVRVKLAGDTLAGFDALGYCTHHCERECSALVSEEAARTALPDGFEINSSALALIPVRGEEVLCYEFAGDFNGGEYFVYVDDGLRIQEVVKIERGGRRGEVRL